MITSLLYFFDIIEQIFFCKYFNYQKYIEKIIKLYKIVKNNFKLKLL